jgi:uncharacterized RDD family membrane protein YckC
MEETVKADDPYRAPQRAVEPRRQTGSDLASRVSRLVGALIDTMILMAVLLPIQIASGVYAGFPNDTELSVVDGLLWSAVGVAVFAAINGYLLAKSGQSIGKRIVGTRISTSDRRSAGLGRILLLRYLPTWLVSSLPVFGVLVALVDCLFVFRRDRRCLHDLIADTIVVNS